jgi:uncharacterized protein (DUF169 family)
MVQYQTIKKMEVYTMATLKELNSFGEELRNQLLLKTYPIAIKLLEKESDIPKEATRPKRDLGRHIALCQGFSMSRREGAMVAMTKQDHWCYVPVIALGQAKAPEFVLEGNMDYPSRIADPQMAKNIVQNSAHLELGKYIAIVSAPLDSTSFIPDVVTIYGDSAQLRFLLSAIRYKNGYQVTSLLEPGGACVQATVPVMKTGECNVAVPCMGDRTLALAQDDEMIFSIPIDKIDDLMAGMRHFDKTGPVFPIKFNMCFDYQLMESYKKAGRSIGLEM